MDLDRMNEEALDRAAAKIVAKREVVARRGVIGRDISPGALSGIARMTPVYAGMWHPDWGPRPR